MKKIKKYIIFPVIALLLINSTSFIKNSKCSLIGKNTAVIKTLIIDPEPKDN